MNSNSACLILHWWRSHAHGGLMGTYIHVRWKSKGGFSLWGEARLSAIWSAIVVEPEPRCSKLSDNEVLMADGMTRKNGSNTAVATMAPRCRAKKGVSVRPFRYYLLPWRVFFQASHIAERRPRTNKFCCPNLDWRAYPKTVPQTGRSFDGSLTSLVCTVWCRRFEASQKWPLLNTYRERLCHRG